jgi:hypothetical protein
LHPSNEFDEDPPTVVGGFHYEKLPPPQLRITLDPYERFRLAAAIWATRYWMHLLIAGEFIAFIIAAALASRLSAQ